MVGPRARTSFTSGQGTISDGNYSRTRSEGCKAVVVVHSHHPVGFPILRTVRLTHRWCGTRARLRHTARIYTPDRCIYRTRRELVARSVRKRYTQRSGRMVGVYVSVFMAITPLGARDNDPRYTPVNVASIRGGFVFRKTLSLALPMPMLINYGLTNVRRLQLHALLRSLIHPRRLPRRPIPSNSRRASREIVSQNATLSSIKKLLNTAFNVSVKYALEFQFRSWK